MGLIQLIWSKDIHNLGIIIIDLLKPDKKISNEGHYF